ncbi:hypothetical protein Sango_1418300 [Sesamum angolense]|uniref:Uncharacterized protein n=1 Tax=Sesamum angolense TaxID=2727404 RepID=A0AAE1WTL2_9LAMI|nr:hypothetical protein Sango_1418300 [Sesamum angolense]
MGITEKQQSRLRHYIGAPKRFLRRARDLYVDSMVSFDGRVASANALVPPAAYVTHPPKSFGGYGASSKRDSDDSLEGLYQSISQKYNWSSSMEFNKAGLSKSQQRVVGGCSAMDRSYSVALGKIGTIYEEEACEFEEHVVMKSEMMFLRSRSVAVARKNGSY